MKLETSYILSEQQIKKRDQLYNELITNEWIIEFINKYNCPNEIIKENAYRFSKWIKDKEMAQHIRIEEVGNGHSGDFIDLVYDSKTNILQEVIRKTKVLEEIEANEEYLNQYRILPLPKNFESASFANMKSSILKENKSYQDLFKLLYTFDTDPVLGYYIYGDLGVGKSYLSACVTNKVAKAKGIVGFVHVPSLINELKQNFNNSSYNESMLNQLKRVPILVLDDLGAEPITSWSRDEILLTILNDRLENHRKTIITGNYPPEHLVDAYSIDTKGVVEEIRARRLIDRVLALTSPYHLVGKNKRFVK